MTNERFNISRRKALASLGTIGVASASAGLGTSAYFSDQETFENNQLTAGTLDMKVGWSEHYSDSSADETAGIPPQKTVGENTLDTVLMERPDKRAGRYTGFPIGARGGKNNDEKSIWVLDEVVGDFMDNTAVEAYPDDGAGDGTVNDGIQDAIDTICGADSDLADAPDDMDPTMSDRTATDYQSDAVGRAEATYDSETGEALPLIYLEDLKPGDFGEVTFTFALCDNPGYVWLTGGGVDDLIAENGTTEPEADDPDEKPGKVELLDEIQVALWHDHDCDNLRDRSTRPSWKDKKGEAVHGGIDGDGNVDNNELWIDPETGERIPDQQGARAQAITSLRDFLGYLETPAEGQDVAGIPLDGEATAGGRDCFAARDIDGNLVEHCIGLSWWLPVDHANEIQTDSVGFDLGFYTEQCRHNDGEGMAPEATSLSADSPQGQGDGFANEWDISETLAHSGNGSWGTISRDPQSVSSYKQGFYFAGGFDNIDVLTSTYTVSDIEAVSYWLYEPTALEGVDVYLNIYTRPEGDGDDADWYDSRLQALPSEANGGSPNFTPDEWNKFSTAAGASNTLTWSDTGRGGNFNQSLPTLEDIQSDSVDWSTYGANLSLAHDYRDEEILALSLQTGSQSGIDLEAYIDDVTVQLENGDTLRLDLEP
ncbi:MAG: SipW-dependent-type signal peptide-containing protein [Natronomonas sp.]